MGYSCILHQWFRGDVVKEKRSVTITFFEKKNSF